MQERRRNNVRVGVFVTVALILAVAVVIALSDVASVFGRQWKHYTVSFDVASGVSNLKEGAEVRVGGLPMGEVDDVRPKIDARQDTGTATFNTILVDIKLDSRLTLYDNAMILLSTPLLGSEAWLDCYSVGDPATGKPIGEGETIFATSTVGMLTNLLGPQNASRAESIVRDAEAAVRSTRSFTATLDEQGLLMATVGRERGDDADALVDNLQATVENAKTITDDFSAVSADLRGEHWPMWSSRVDELMDWATSATASFDETMNEGHALLTDTRAAINENREGFDRIVANTESFTDRLGTELADKAADLLDRGNEGLEEAVAVIERIQTDYERWSVDVGDSLANASLASQQLKLAMIEVRRSPWKVLYRPTQDELEHELLYEATRSFAVAAADVKAASESVRRILEQHGDRVAGSPELQQRITATLLDPLERYEKAQQQLFDVLVTESR